MSKGLVYLGMSGGVDSSVSAALLKEQGYEVVGVFITVWQPDFIVCTASADRLDAIRVCSLLDIPFKDLDLTDVYKREVVDYMISEYAKGRTPNPDVLCNREVKFGAFFEWALQEHADFVATGHYAQVSKDGDAFELRMSADAKKDQSYFLWTLHQKHLSKTLFPVGGMEKSEVRKHAERFKLPTASKKDSQGLCFIGKFDFKEFLGHFLTSEPGTVLDTHGNEIGTHSGAIFYTLGERHGFTVTKQSPGQKPLYIVSKDIPANTITVSERIPDTPSEFAITTIELSGCSWTGNSPKEGEQFLGRFRYRQALIPLTISKVFEENATISFEKPIEYVPEGQSLVLYEGDQLVGGGIIASTSL